MPFRGNHRLLNASGCRGLAMACRTPLTTEQRRQSAKPEIGAYVPPTFYCERTNDLGQYKAAARCCEAVAEGNVLVKPLIWERNQTRGTPYAGKAFSRATGRARRVPNTLFGLQRFQLGGKKGHEPTARTERLSRRLCHIGKSSA
jgi:hypothetical protein